ncbi:MAG: hypothetical protein ACPG19_12340 [Saprospiraceae bacterium]
MTHLSKQEARSLIKKYESELKKLIYQANKVRETIFELKEQVGLTESTLADEYLIFSEAAKGKSSVVDLLKSNIEVDLPETGTGYRLSKWDLFILNSLRATNMTLVNSDLFKLANQQVKDEGLELSEVQLRGKLNRSIHKLTHRRGLLLKVPYEGKGYAYALSTWLDEDGKLKKEYERDDF